MPNIAIIVPVYGAAPHLVRCLQSIAAQVIGTDDRLTVTVVDDGNNPPLQLPALPAGLVVSLLRQHHAGAPAARNCGARATSGELVLFCDADIELRPDALARMLAALATHPEASYAYSAFRFGWKRFSSFPFDPDRLRTMPYIHTTALIRREHFPGFDESLTRFQDWDLWWTMLDAGHPGIYVPEELFRIRAMHGSMSRWFPAIALRLPWRMRSVRAYDAARARILAKHASHQPCG